MKLVIENKYDVEFIEYHSKIDYFISKYPNSEFSLEFFLSGEFLIVKVYERNK